MMMNGQFKTRTSYYQEFFFFFDIGYCFTGKGALWLNDLMDYICFFLEGIIT